MESEYCFTDKTFKFLHSKKTINIRVSIIQESKNQEQKVLLIFQDVTKLKKFQKQKQSQLYKTVYFASIAHDLRTPLGTVMAINNQLQEIVGQEHIQWIKISNSSCNFLLAILDDIFDLSKLQLGQFNLQKQWVGL